MKYLKEGLDYIFLDDVDIHPTTPVKLLTGEYKDVIVCYGKIKIIETEENGDGILSFTFKILSPTVYSQLESDPKFKDYLGNILDSIILEADKPATDEPKMIEEVVNETRESDFEELDDRPRVRQEGSPLLKG